jgi:hypothetical protein
VIPSLVSGTSTPLTAADGEAGHDAVPFRAAPRQVAADGRHSGCVLFLLLPSGAR